MQLTAAAPQALAAWAACTKKSPASGLSSRAHEGSAFSRSKQERKGVRCNHRDALFLCVAPASLSMEHSRRRLRIRLRSGRALPFHLQPRQIMCQN